MNLGNFYTSSQHSDTPPKDTGGGGAGEEQKPAEKTEQQAHEDKAARLFDTLKPAEQRNNEQKPAKTDEDRARALYSPDSTYGDTTLIADVPAGATAEQIQQVNSDYRAELNNMELPGTLARELTNKFTTGMRAPISDAEYDTKVASFTTELGRRFGGAEHVEERLADVRALLAKAHPAVADALVESGLHLDPDVIVELANHARSLKGRGRLS